ncbi:unnamed protein product [Penicillium manginii]
MRRFRPATSSRRKYYLVVALLLVLILVKSLPWLQSAVQGHAHSHVADKPRYLYRSTFRDNPDTAYEQQLSQALRDIEAKQLTLHGPAAPSDTIWQIILGKDPGTEERGSDSLEFEEKNSDWKYKLVTTEWAEEFVTITLSSIPGLSTLYQAYPHHVLRADLLRYLILWYYGGYYADTDVFPARSIKSCPSLQKSVFKTDVPDISLVVGIEIDEPFASPQKMHDWHWVRSYGFIQYTMFAPRQFSPLLREIIVRVLSHSKRHLDESNVFLGPRYNELTTLEITGPGVFTDAILDVLSDTLPASHPFVSESVTADTGLGELISPETGGLTERVTWAPFSGLSAPRCVQGSEAKKGAVLGGLCVLPINAWGNGQRHSGAENFFSTHACINHRFGGTWKPWKQSWKKYLFG